MGHAASAIRAGDVVLVRRQRWHVTDVRVAEKCRLLTVTGTEPLNAGVERHFLLPFDTADKVAPSTALRFVRPSRWRRVLRALVADQTPPGGLRAARHARIDLLPHQLEPALAIVGGHGSRVLLADDVGLGKTIQAGLIIKELKARGMVERVLILTPAGLRDQWAAELADRFSIDAAVVDFRDVRRRVATLPVGLNPWATVPVAVASIDYIKRPETLQSVRTCRWDVLAIDEAHGVAPGSDRHAAIAALASRAAYVLLLTATPHNGDRHAFQALCQTGASGDPLLVFRRTRSDVALGAGRHVHRLHVRLSDEEARMHAFLREFTRAVQADRGADEVRLALSVLHKRALSSAGALAQSVERRLAVLRRRDHGDDSHQLALPLSDAEGELDPIDAAPSWADALALTDPVRESRMLDKLADSAKKAARSETKLKVILRLLGRVKESIVIFTEYRDTLLLVQDALDRPVSILHGGLTREERSSALNDFLRGRRRILLATDAAGEGLNLHEQCRVVVNLELPWNPMRLEQRIGRVDRIGQHRAVHVFHLIARDSGEEGILNRLRQRLASARDDIAVPNPLGDERAVAKLVLNEPEEQTRPSEPAGQAWDASDRSTVHLADRAASEATRLAFARRLADSSGARTGPPLELGGGWITTARLLQTRVRLGRRILAVLRIDYEDDHGRICDSTLVALAFGASNGDVLTDPRQLRPLLSKATPWLQASVHAEAARQLVDFERLRRALFDRRLARERAIAETFLDDTRAPFQVGLFERRAERVYLSDRTAHDQAARDTAREMEMWSRGAKLTVAPARLVLALLP